MRGIAERRGDAGGNTPRRAKAARGSEDYWLQLPATWRTDVTRSVWAAAAPAIAPAPAVLPVIDAPLDVLPAAEPVVAPAVADGAVLPAAPLVDPDVEPVAELVLPGVAVWDGDAVLPAPME